MRRIIIVLLMAATILPRSAVADSGSPPSPTSSLDAQSTVGFPWIAKWFADAVGGWLVGKVLDYGVDRVLLARRGQQAADHVSDLSARRGFSNADIATLREAEARFRTIAGTLARTDLSDDEARRRITALEHNLVGRLAQLSQRLSEFEHRIYTLELQQRRQLRMLVELNGQVIALGDRLYDLEGRFAYLTERVDSIDTQVTNVAGQLSRVEQRTDRLEEVVYPDPHRYLRHGTYFSLYGLYADATAMAGDANIGVGLSVQANLTKRIGVFGETAIIPLKATDGLAPDGSPLEWVIFPVTVGFALNVLPPQSPLSIQLSGGTGISYSSLRYYPEDYDPDLGNWEDVTDVASLIGTAKIEIGASPVLSDFEPVLTIGYLGFQNAMNYSNGSTSSNAGRELLYVSLGGRLRTNLPGERGRTRQ
jgi:uncharacterized coiled-coil protein SlyX